ncbi:MAG TPA: 50S ribosomal protein L3 [Methanocorpusculum sp.]|uniref:50S ribosomal protein L3 n=1 Tax=Methanocorpusculum sp. GPch4 TaxID=2527877 RepID=UPI001433291F|nr:50S ribosomal protein L3 [Methanocorpusculum sp. GPch4]HJJ35319.1 50S ribosomal protein L3 [Methanocorpusculum sp.]
MRTVRPRAGSLAYYPKVRAKGIVPKYQSWPAYNGQPMLQGFAGYKAGMTHVIMIDDRKKSPTEGKEVMVPVTVIEIPAMSVAAIRVYVKDTYGKHPLTEVWAENLEALSGRITKAKTNNAAKATEKINAAIDDVVEVMVLMYTKPTEITGIPKKVPDLMEIRVAGGSAQERFDYALSILGTDVDMKSLLSEGQFADITGITKGKGFQGAVKRFGITLRKRKHARTKKERHIGTLGPWTPHHVRWQVPMPGQMGFQQRTEFNKRIIKIGENADEINPAGGFLHYGLVRNNYVLIKGSIPGPAKRLVRIRSATRMGEQKIQAPVVEYVSLQSKQG